MENKVETPPEFIRVAEAVRRFGLSKAKIYQLISGGEIITRCLRKRGQVKGTRLIDYDSLRGFIDSCPVNTTAEE